MIIKCGSRPWTFGQTVVSDRPVSSIWTVILELIPFTWDLSWLKVQLLTMSMSMSSMNLVFLFLSTWHQRFLEAVAFFDLIGGALQGHWDKFQSAVSNHWETRLLIGSIHFLHLTFESISKPKILNQGWVIRMNHTCSTSFSSSSRFPAPSTWGANSIFINWCNRIKSTILSLVHFDASSWTTFMSSNSVRGGSGNAWDMSIRRKISIINIDETFSPFKRVIS